MADNCEEETFVSVSEKFGGDKKLPACNPAVQRVPDEFKEPEGTLEPQEPLRTPGPTLVGNVLRRASCLDLYDDDVYGNGVAVPAWTYVENYRLVASGYLTEYELDYIASIDGGQALSELFHDAMAHEWTEERLTESVGALLRISSETAGNIVSDLIDIQAELDEAAYSQALAGLRCYWLNKEVRQDCSDIGDYVLEDLATPAEHPDAVVHYVVPEGLFTSDVSQEDADNQATVAAGDKLNCFYVSEPVTVRCTDPDRPGKPTAGGDEEVPVEQNTLVPSRKPRRGVVTLPKGYYTSTVSKEDATQRARVFAQSMLVCYYINDYTRQRCGHEDARPMGVDPLIEDAVKGDVHTMTQGQDVIVPTAHIVSELSTADANRQAKDLALSLLECCYISPEVKRTCDDILLVDEHGNPVLDAAGRQVRIKPSDRPGALPEKVIPRGMFLDCVADDFETDREANIAVMDNLRKQAEEAAGGALECTYCNTIVLPTCVPQWVIDAITTGIELPDGRLYTLSLPLNPSRIEDPWTGELIDTSQWSKDATAGAPANMFCADDYYAAQQLADVAGMQLMDEISSKEEECEFSNDKVYGTCCAPNPFVRRKEEADEMNDKDTECKECHGTIETMFKWRGYYVETGNTGDCEEGRPYIWVSATKWPPTCEIGEGSSPSKGSFVTVNEDSVRVTISQTPGTKRKDEDGYDPDMNMRMAKQYANELAMEAVTSLMCCLRPPTKVLGFCELSGVVGTETNLGKWDDMPEAQRSVVVRGPDKGGDECCNCEHTIYVIKPDGMERLSPDSPTFGAPIELDYASNSCFNQQYGVGGVPTLPGGEKACSVVPPCEEEDKEAEEGSSGKLADIIETVKNLTWCQYGNVPIEASCYGYTEYNPDIQETETIESVGSEIVVPENTVITELWYKSQLIAESLAMQLQLANCMYGNVTVKGKCECDKCAYELMNFESMRSLIPFKCGKVPANTVFAPTAAQAKKIAQRMADTMTECRLEAKDDLTPFKVSWYHPAQYGKVEQERTDCCSLPTLAARISCYKKHRGKRRNYSDVKKRVNGGKVYIGRNKYVQCSPKLIDAGTDGQVTMKIVRGGLNEPWTCKYYINGTEITTPLTGGTP